ncbi:hypothetical protein BDW72DRAFT_185711 [Aspergillus terricola var. indicus]
MTEFTTADTLNWNLLERIDRGVQILLTGAGPALRPGYIHVSFGGSGAGGPQRTERAPPGAVPLGWRRCEACQDLQVY